MSQQNKWKVACALLAVIATCDFGITNAQSPEFRGPRFEGPRRPDSPPANVQGNELHAPRNGHSGSSNNPSHAYGQRPSPPRTPMPQVEQALEWAMFLQHRFHQRVELDAEISLNELPRLIQEEWEVPCTLDRAAMRIASVDPSSAVVELRARELPLRVALNRALAPLNLAAQLTPDGITVTANFTELARAGIATDRWAGISAQVAKQMESDLGQTVSIEADNMPLRDATQALQERLHHSIEIDGFALEGEGLPEDAPVTVQAQEASFDSVMNRMLRELNLTLHFENDAWVVTTIEAAEERPLQRIYYLEATGLTESIGEAMQLIQTSVDPESWEVLGGMGTMAALPSGGSNRPAILVSTTLSIHLETEALFDALRAGTVGEDVPTKSVPFQDPMSSGSFHSGWFCGTCLQAAAGSGNASGSSQNSSSSGTPQTPQQTGGMF